MSVALVFERHVSAESTNDLALARARAGAPAGTVVIAEEQTAGRGQRGARWSSPAGSGLYMSVVLRPRLSPQRSPLLTLAAGVAVQTALDALVPGRIRLKWPNDLVVPAEALPADRASLGFYDDGRRKLSGILVEAALEPGAGSGPTDPAAEPTATGLAHAVAGVGLNLRDHPGLDPVDGIALADLLDPGTAPDAGDLATAIAERLFAEVARLEAGDATGVVEAWSRVGYGLGRRVRLSSPNETVEGRMSGLDPESGALILTPDHGLERRFVHGRLTFPGGA